MKTNIYCAILHRYAAYVYYAIIIETMHSNSSSDYDYSVLHRVYILDEFHCNS